MVIHVTTEKGRSYYKSTIWNLFPLDDLGSSFFGWFLMEVGGCAFWDWGRCHWNTNLNCDFCDRLRLLFLGSQYTRQRCRVYAFLRYKKGCRSSKTEASYFTKILFSQVITSRAECRDNPAAVPVRFNNTTSMFRAKAAESLVSVPPAAPLSRVSRISAP